ncbi:MAG: peptide chain release factor 2 [candidate division WOR-3 bacterium]|nr:peptide chain release factor 2 [candidate division WOR-3 bacterium]
MPDFPSVIKTLSERLTTLQEFLEIDKKKQEIALLTEKSQKPDFWQDPKTAKEILGQIQKLSEIVRSIEQIKREIEEAQELLALFAGDEHLENELNVHLNKIEKDLFELQSKSLFLTPEDSKKAILTIHPGAGGVESCDWAEMLFRMYTKYFNRKGFKYHILDYQPAEEAGIKDAVIEVLGENAYGLLKAEIGIHRLVRISPFDANKRRHTSFAAVFVYPEIEDVEVNINPNDLKIDTFRASGHGGQAVNKISSAVRITHIPTGIVVTCQNERSQFQNKQNAMKILRARLYDYYKKQQDEKLQKLEETKTEIAWGHQIRSYVFFPYQMVKDHRTGLETGDIQKVMDGDLDDFIYAFLLSKQNKSKPN